jgi:thymidylate synthase ThyX
MVYISDLVRRAIAKGMSGNQARYPLPNCATVDLCISASLGNIWNFVGLRACGREQFENNYLSRKVAKTLKDVLPNLTQKLGPRCIYEGFCREGKGCCGRQAEMLTEFLGDSANLTNSLKEYERQMDLADKLEYNDSAFIENYQKAYQEYLDMLKHNQLPVVQPIVRFRSGPPDLEKLCAENARNTYARLTGDKFVSDMEISPEEIDRVLKFVTKAGHFGVVGHQEITYDTKMSRVMLQKFARHSSLKLMGSSQHHSKHINFEYVMPPEWPALGLDVEFHVWNRYADGMYSRALAADIARDQARYTLPTDATVNLRISASPRDWYSVGRQRGCPSNSWEDKTIITNLAMDLKDRYPGMFYYLGPPCLIGLCGDECADKASVKKLFLKEKGK